jgi:hypothetical protein
VVASRDLDRQVTIPIVSVLFVQCPDFTASVVGRTPVRVNVSSPDCEHKVALCYCFFPSRHIAIAAAPNILHSFVLRSGALLRALHTSSPEVNHIYCSAKQGLPLRHVARPPELSQSARGDNGLLVAVEVAARLCALGPVPSFSVNLPACGVPPHLQ